MARLFFPALLLGALIGCRGFSLTTSQRFPALELPKEPAPEMIQPVSAQTAPARPVSESKERPAEPIALALDSLERGDNAAAVRHLKEHVTRNADQLLFRAQLAELLLGMNRFAEAQVEFEAVIACSQEGSPGSRSRLVHYHTRLMEIAREREDEYGEYLHRGIGLHLVACQLASKGDSGEVERLQCKAAAALKEAQSHRPEDARVAWYLYRVWSQLDQPRPAEKALNKAVATAAFSKLTPLEARELALVGRPGSVLK